jgi:hypothetical protein
MLKMKTNKWIWNEYEMNMKWIWNDFWFKDFLKLSFLKTFSRWLWFKDQIEETNTMT